MGRPRSRTEIRWAALAVDRSQELAARRREPAGW